MLNSFLIWNKKKRCNKIKHNMQVYMVFFEYKHISYAVDVYIYLYFMKRFFFLLKVHKNIKTEWFSFNILCGFASYIGFTYIHYTYILQAIGNRVQNETTKIPSRSSEIATKGSVPIGFIPVVFQILLSLSKISPIPSNIPFMIQLNSHTSSI